MVNRARRLGTEGENGVIRYLRSHGFPHVERRVQSGALDKGDIAIHDEHLTGVPGWVIEVKNVKADSWGTFLKETVRERDNHGAAHGVMIRKRRGYREADHWYALMEVEDFVRLMREAGYGDPL